MQERDSEGFQVLGMAPRHDCPYFFCGNGYLHIPLGIKAFGHLVDILKRDHRPGGKGRREPVIFRLLRLIQLQNMTEAGSDEQTDTRKAVLE